ncbi:DNA-binding response regulator [Azospirillum brasilense]|uniref:DNA-binding response regulator n=2 Tax=Azospirillum TaxID=191 RepID=A0A0P0ECC4_AZOBR|nr:MULTISPECIES: response regulator transcription factor [Azospirillum]ALJ35244.1 two-component system response regulator [Azospirillum brasilense]MDW7555221.1 response regulator transcription factor [Azospirillum brasilense]MDW7594998.1 response regulator transcription factor [Azospirillum brasilense]MDW7629787.1 response regulator transcription factor [Azospirillum brasilense]MDX5953946.1 response regulator transcription factor [Azospirillum brasilense]
MQVLIADDHSIVRSGLTHLVGELDEQAGVTAATSFGQLTQLLDQGPYDLVIMDLRMPGLGGLDEVEAVVKRVAPVPVVVFSMIDSPDEMRAVLSRGVRAFIPKSTDDVLVVNILRLVMAGGSYVPPVLGMPGIAQAPAAAKAHEPSVFDGMTRRQLEVLDLLAQGLSNQEIGERLGLNLSTVKTHVTGVLKALGVGSRTQAVLLVKESGRDRLV